MQASADDPEVRATCHKTTRDHHNLAERLEKFSSWKCATRAIANLQDLIRTKRGTDRVDIVSALQRAELSIIKSVQSSTFESEIASLSSGMPISRSSRLLKLHPSLDENGLLRVGGRLQNCETLSFDVKHPIILPKNFHVTSLLVKHHHEVTAHQGKGITLGRLRTAGLWVIGGSSAVGSYIVNCAVCHKA